VSITSADTTSLTFLTTNNPLNNYVTLPSTVSPEYGYILIPVSLPQPTGFKDSNNGCTGNDAPLTNFGTLVVLDTNGFAITYNIYRSYWPFAGQLFCWLCN
jgi:hypothetical protein